MQARIELQTRQQAAGETDVFRFAAPAELTETTEGLLVHYLEEQEAGTTETALLITAEQLCVTRRGAMNSELQYAVGRVMEVPYETPLGMLMLCFQTKVFKLLEKSNWLRLHLEYDILQEQTLMSHNTLDIKIEYSKT